MVIHISFSDISGQCVSYRDYIRRIEKRLVKDLRRAFPDVELDQEDSAVDALLEVYAQNSTNRFILLWMNGTFCFIRTLPQRKKSGNF